MEDRKGRKAGSLDMMPVRMLGRQKVRKRILLDSF